MNRLDRLTASDLAMLWGDDLGWPQDIGALAILDGTGLFDRDDRFTLDAARHAVAGRLLGLDRFRQVLVRPRWGLGWPLWVDAAAVDLAHHIRVAEVPAPGDHGRLLRTVEELRRRRLDPSRPLWEVWFLTGLPEHRIGLFVKLHHTIADGAAGIALLGALCDIEPVTRRRPVPSWTAAPRPTTSELLRDNLRRRWSELVRAGSWVARLPTALRDLRAAWPAFREAFAEELAPRTSLSRPLGPGRRLALVRSRLDLVKQVAHAHDAKANDVLMTAMSNGLRHMLLRRGEQVDGVVLRAYVPVSLHRERTGQARGNLDGMMVVRLPVGVEDPASVLGHIAAETAERRKLRRASGGALFRFSRVQRNVMKFMTRQRWANTYAANVPGPPMLLYFAGAPVLELFPLVPLTGNVTIGVGALSYAGQFNVTVVADEDACPDIDVFTSGFEDALSALARPRARTVPNPGGGT